jgi:hypothetical protein
MTRRNLAAALVDLGWRNTPTDAALVELQRALGLRPDGVNGPLTREAVRRSLRQHKAGKPSASLWFSFDEFACGCGGHLPGCRGIVVQPELLHRLDYYRSEGVRGPVVIVSGYRCPMHNKRVGGAPLSQHLYGAAADVNYRLSWRKVRALRLFAGIGRSRRTGKVRHVDVRDVSGHNTTGGTPAAPTVWDYAA